jgi:inner membrane protein
MLAGTVAGAFPDSDFVLGYVSQIAWLVGHRGVTHSILLLPVWAALLAWVFAKLARERSYFRPFFVVCACAIALHIAGDVITTFGTMLLAPLSDYRFALSTTFIIDLWFSGIVLAGVIASVVLRASRMPAAAALVLLAGYVGFSGVQQQRAIEVGTEHARASGWTDALVVALPRPVSPFNWMVVIEHGDRYEFAMVNLRREEALPVGADSGFIRRLDAVYLPVKDAVWSPATHFGLDEDARELSLAVWDHPDFAVFRWFYARPALHAIKRTPGEQCVWFEDLRFRTPGRGVLPFRYGMCRPSESEPWQRYELVGRDTRVPL